MRRKDDMGEQYIRGFVVIDEHTDDMTQWSGAIAFPNPQGATLFWEKPKEFITIDAYNDARKKIRDLEDQLRAALFSEEALGEELTIVEKERDRYKLLHIEYADLENPNPPERVCWPTSEYMKKSRAVLAQSKENDTKINQSNEGE